MWTRRKVARLETWNGTLVVVGWDTHRHCGCVYREAMTVDRARQEPAFGAEPCDQHEVHVRRALADFRSLPPSEEQAGSLYERLLDVEIDPYLAAAEAAR